MNASLVVFTTPGSREANGIISITFSNADYAGSGGGAVDRDGGYTLDVSAGQVLPPRAISIDLNFGNARLFERQDVCLDGSVNIADINGAVVPGGTYMGKVAWNGSKGVITISWNVVPPAAPGNLTAAVG